MAILIHFYGSELQEPLYKGVRTDDSFSYDDSIRFAGIGYSGSVSGTAI
jgi:hypothetical protein